MIPLKREQDTDRNTDMWDGSFKLSFFLEDLADSLHFNSQRFFDPDGVEAAFGTIWHH